MTRHFNLADVSQQAYTTTHKKKVLGEKNKLDKAEKKAVQHWLHTQRNFFLLAFGASRNQRMDPHGTAGTFFFFEDYQSP